jgi:hypothetical protein
MALYLLFVSGGIDEGAGGDRPTCLAGGDESGKVKEVRVVRGVRGTGVSRASFGVGNSSDIMIATKVKSTRG